MTYPMVSSEKHGQKQGGQDAFEVPRQERDTPALQVGGGDVAPRVPRFNDSAAGGSQRKRVRKNDPGASGSGSAKKKMKEGEPPQTSTTWLKRTFYSGKTLLHKLSKAWTRPKEFPPPVTSPGGSPEGDHQAALQEVDDNDHGSSSTRPLNIDLNQPLQASANVTPSPVKRQTNHFDLNKSPPREDDENAE